MFRVLCHLLESMNVQQRPHLRRIRPYGVRSSDDVHYVTVQAQSHRGKKNHSKNQDATHNISQLGENFPAYPLNKMNKLEEILSCPVCLVVPRDTPIYQCKNGHLICKNCYKIVEISDACPVCKTKLPRHRIRNITAEQVIDNNPGFNFPCDFSVHGCIFKGRKVELGIHEKRCKFRTVPCPNTETEHLRTCNGVRSLEGLINHLAQNRRTTLQVGELNIQQRKLFSWNGRKEDWIRNVTYPPQIYSIDGNNFIFKAIRKDGIFYAWLQVAADSNVADKYTVGMNISNNGTTLTEKGKVFPIDMAQSMVLGQGEGVMCFGEMIAKKLEKFVSFIFTISKVKEPNSASRSNLFEELINIATEVARERREDLKRTD